MAATTFRELRHKLDDLGYYQVNRPNLKYFFSQQFGIKTVKKHAKKSMSDQS